MEVNRSALALVFIPSWRNGENGVLERMVASVIDPSWDCFPLLGIYWEFCCLFLLFYFFSLVLSWGLFCLLTALFWRLGRDGLLLRPLYLDLSSLVRTCSFWNCSNIFSLPHCNTSIVTTPPPHHLRRRHIPLVLFRHLGADWCECYSAHEN